MRESILALEHHSVNLSNQMQNCRCCTTVDQGCRGPIGSIHGILSCSSTFRDSDTQSAYCKHQPPNCPWLYQCDESPSQKSTKAVCVWWVMLSNDPMRNMTFHYSLGVHWVFCCLITSVLFLHILFLQILTKSWSLNPHGALHASSEAPFREMASSKDECRCRSLSCTMLGHDLTTEQ